MSFDDIFHYVGFIKSIVKDAGVLTQLNRGDSNMGEKILGLLGKVIAVLPAVIADVQSAESKIKADKTVADKVDAGLQAATAAFDEIAKVFTL